MYTFIADKYIIKVPNTETEFYFGEKDGAKCWPLRHDQGCYYGDCLDCSDRWVERLKLMEKLPADLLQEKDKEEADIPLDLIDADKITLYYQCCECKDITKMPLKEHVSLASLCGECTNMENFVEIIGITVQGEENPSVVNK